MNVVETHDRPLAQTSAILPVHKPAGMTSRSVVDEVETRCDVDKVGHGGTLDPLAEGVLPLHLNEATKVVEYLHENPKTYRVRCRFDLRSPSLDLGEEVSSVESAEPIPSRKELQSQLQYFEGSQQQVPPNYSAIKVDGKPLYEWSRSSDEIPEVESRRVHCHSLRILHYDYPSLTFTVTCGKGFYVRSLVRDLAERFDQPGGIVTVLVRTKYGPYRLGSCAQLDDPADEWRPLARPPRSALDTIPVRHCDRRELRSITNGGRIPREIFERDRAAAVGPDGRVHALLEPAKQDPEKYWKPKRVLNRKTTRE